MSWRPALKKLKCTFYQMSMYHVKYVMEQGIIEKTLNIKYKGKNIAEVLDMRVSEALEFFSNVPKIKNKLQVLEDVGLGYIN